VAGCPPRCLRNVSPTTNLERHHTGRFTTLPVSYTVDHRRQRLHAVASGALSIADLGTYIASRVKDGVSDYDQLIDLSDATLEVVSQDVLNMVRQAQPNMHQKSTLFTAILARQGTATHGLARQLATLFDFDGAVHIAESFNEATAWLDHMRSGERHADHK
jgi:hypothetical protein